MTDDVVKFHETLKRMLSTPPEAHESRGKVRASDPSHKEKPDGRPVKKDRPEDQ